MSFNGSLEGVHLVTRHVLEPQGCFWAIFAIVASGSVRLDVFTFQAVILSIKPLRCKGRWVAYLRSMEQGKYAVHLPLSRPMANGKRLKL